MTWPLILLAVGSVVAGAFLILGQRFVNWLGPVPGSRRPRTASGAVSGVVTLVLVVAGRGRWPGSMYGRVPVPAVAPRGRPLTVAARQDLYGDAFNESVLMRPGQWLTRLSVFFDNRGVDGVVNGSPPRSAGRPAGAQAADRLRPLLRPVHVRRRRCAGRRCSWW